MTSSANGHAPKRVALYCRVSTDEQAKSGYSLDDQLRELRGWAEREAVNVVTIIRDDGYSGGNPDRPGLNRIYQMAERGEIDAAVATKRDRWFRHRLHRLLFDQDMQEYGVAVVALNDTNNIIGDSVLDSFAEYERQMISERTQAGKRQKAYQGAIIATNPPPYGFNFNATRDNYEIDEDYMPTVRRIFKQVADGASLRSIVQSLNSEGASSPSTLKRGKSGYWSQRTVRRLIRSDVYMPYTHAEIRGFVDEGAMSPDVLAQLDPEREYGIWRYADVVVPVPAAGIPRETVERARRALSEHRQSSNAGRRFWTLSSGLFRCGMCGGPMERLTVNRKKYDRCDYYYRCRRSYSVRPQPCANRHLFRAEKLEAEVWWKVHTLNADGSLTALVEDTFNQQISAIDDLVNHQANAVKRLFRLTEQLEKLEARRSGLIDLAADGTITRDDLKAHLDSIEDERVSVQDQLDAFSSARDRLLQLELRRDSSLERIENGFFGLTPQTPEEVHAAYREMDLRVEADGDGEVTLSGNLDPAEDGCEMDQRSSAAPRRPPRRHRGPR
jgi:site-specific DNA recombinase